MDRPLLRPILIVLPFALLGLTLGEFGCRSSNSDLSDFVSRVSSDIDRRLVSVEHHIDAQVATLGESYKKAKAGGCRSVKPSESELSSVYLPSSVKLGTHLNCADSASKTLEERWSALFQNSRMFSWIYFYDSRSRMMRIHPPTNTKALFGDNLVFDHFSFFTNAKKKFPAGAWSSVKYDINGTGKIVIYSRALDLNGDSKPESVLSVDVRASELAPHLKDEFAKRIQVSDSDLFFVLGLVPSSESRAATVFSFASNEVKWATIYRENEKVFSASEEQRKGFFKMAGARRSIESRKIQLKNYEFSCSASYLSRNNMMIIGCLEE